MFGADGRAATFDAWWLSLWYQELALLRLLGHQGSYANRTRIDRWVGQIEPVPWRESGVSVCGRESTESGGKGRMAVDKELATG